MNSREPPNGWAVEEGMSRVVPTDDGETLAERYDMQVAHIESRITLRELIENDDVWRARIG